MQVCLDERDRGCAVVDGETLSILPSTDARFELELCYRTEACNVGSITIVAPRDDVSDIRIVADVG